MSKDRLDLIQIQGCTRPVYKRLKDLLHLSTRMKLQHRDESKCSSLKAAPLAGLQRRGHRYRDSLPLIRLGSKLPTARNREPVVFCFPIVLGLAPGWRQPAGFFHAMQRGKKRSRFHLKSALRDLFYPAGKTQAMHWFQNQSFENQEVKSALQEIGRFLGRVAHIDIL